MEREKVLKALDYAAGFFLLMTIAMSFSRWAQNSDFYPVWLIILFFALFLTLYLWRAKINRNIMQPLPAPTLDMTPGEKEAEREARQKRWKEDLELEKAAHELIVKMCESKNIRLKMKQEGRSMGHYDIPETWTIEKPVPLTPDDLYAITVNRVLHAVTNVGDEKTVYAEKFSRGGGWVVYEQEN